MRPLFPKADKKQGVEDLDIRLVHRRRGLAKDIRGSRQQLLFPFDDRRHDQGLSGRGGTDRRQHASVNWPSSSSSIRFRRVRLHHLAPLVHHQLTAPVKPGCHLRGLPEFSINTVCGRRSTELIGESSSGGKQMEA
jgi:hypothetical protein